MSQLIIKYTDVADLAFTLERVILSITSRKDG